MRTDTPRIEPLVAAEWDEAAKEALAPVLNDAGETLNIFATFAKNPIALKAFLEWGTFILFQTALSAREREILILRVGHLGRSGYEFAQHTAIGLQSGLDSKDIKNLQNPGGTGDWTEAESLLIRSADQLMSDHHISDDLWTSLSAHYSEKQLMDIVFVVGQYTQVCMALNSFGVQLES